jgi:hypothetical protein
MGVICHCERSEAISQTGRLLRRYAPRNDGKELAIGAIGEICGCSQLFFAIIKPPGHKRSVLAAKGIAAL